tara:strand:- start:45 stop:236 length:192 start_codon:yes stop_codon:yes gene_type:complete
MQETTKMDIRKYLKKVGISSHGFIEEALLLAKSKDHDSIVVKMELTIEKLGIQQVFEQEFTDK